MAAVLYYMHISANDDRVGEYSQTNDWPNPATGMVVRSATFSSNPGDSPDVVTPRGEPDVNSFYTAGGLYTPAPDSQFYKIRAEWSGGGGVDQGFYYEMVADGINVATLTLTKLDYDGTPLGSGTEAFILWFTGGPLGLDGAKKSMVGGVVTFNFTPPLGTKGMVTIQAINDGHNIPLEANIKLLTLT